VFIGEIALPFLDSTMCFDRHVDNVCKTQRTLQLRLLDPDLTTIVLYCMACLAPT